MATETVAEIIGAETPFEQELLREFREADDAGKRQFEKIVYAAGRGLLPSLAEIKKMTPEQTLAFVAALPDPDEGQAQP